MFIELHDSVTADTFMINKALIKMVIASESGKTAILVEDIIYVKESYEQVKSLLDVSSIG